MSELVVRSYRALARLTLEGAKLGHTSFTEAYNALAELRAQLNDDDRLTEDEWSTLATEIGTRMGIASDPWGR